MAPTLEFASYVSDGMTPYTLLYVGFLCRPLSSFVIRK